MYKKYVEDALCKKTVKWLRKEVRTFGMNISTHTHKYTKAELVQMLLNINSFISRLFTVSGQDGKSGVSGKVYSNSVNVSIESHGYGMRNMDSNVKPFVVKGG